MNNDCSLQQQQTLSKVFDMSRVDCNIAKKRLIYYISKSSPVLCSPGDQRYFVPFLDVVIEGWLLLSPRWSVYVIICCYSDDATHQVPKSKSRLLNLYYPYPLSIMHNSLNRHYYTLCRDYENFSMLRFYVLLNISS